MKTSEKITLFQSFFEGLTSVYGTYDPETGKHWQIKRPVTRQVILNHLKGIQPYGFYPLDGHKTRISVVDFDREDPEAAICFLQRARHYGIEAYLERSKSKGYHLWMFFAKEGVSGRKVRRVIKHILEEIEMMDTEVFPKQDSVGDYGAYGNFINAPLNGGLVPKGKTIFVTPDISLKPHTDQWIFLSRIKRMGESTLDSVIELNDLNSTKEPHDDDSNRKDISGGRFTLPTCIRTILSEGIGFDQRVACFRIAVHLKRIGMPYDLVIATLMKWRLKNRPMNKKRIITPEEIKEQVGWAYKKNYTGYGCKEPIIANFCDVRCPVHKM